jgi:hypothetical protein
MTGGGDNATIFRKSRPTAGDEMQGDTHDSQSFTTPNFKA